MQMDEGHADNGKKKHKRWVYVKDTHMIKHCIHSSIQFNKVIQLYKNKWAC